LSSKVALEVDYQIAKREGRGYAAVATAEYADSATPAKPYSTFA
jgi:hypothetical protein